MTADELPDSLSEREMQRIFSGSLPPKWELVLVSGYFYHREPDGWHRYNAPPEVIDGPQD